VQDAPTQAGDTRGGEKTTKQGKSAELKAERTKLSKVLKESFRPETLAGEILEQRVPVPIGQLLAMKELQQLWFNTFPKPNAAPPESAAVNQIGTADVDDEYDPTESPEPVYYIASTPKIRANVAGADMTILLDSGAEVSLINSRVANKLKLPICPNVSLGMRGIQSPGARFVGICEDVPVSVGRVNYRVPLWVSNDDSDPDLLLGRPYWIQSRIQLKEYGGGLCKGTIMAPDGSRMINFEAAAADAPENRTREDLVRSGTLNALANAQ
jgi:hypothetical protein